MVSHVAVAARFIGRIDLIGCGTSTTERIGGQTVGRQSGNGRITQRDT